MNEWIQLYFWLYRLLLPFVSYLRKSVMKADKKLAFSHVLFFASRVMDIQF